MQPAGQRYVPEVAVLEAAWEPATHGRAAGLPVPVRYVVLMIEVPFQALIRKTVCLIKGPDSVKCRFDKRP